MKSFSLLRTNAALTTNYKIVVTSNYDLYLDSIDSHPSLNVRQLKKFKFNKENSLEYVLSKYWSSTPFEMAYSIKDNEDNNIMYKEFSNQYDPIYNCGGRNIANNKDYNEEFEYFAPLHISKGYLPTHFIIFRIDGPGLLNLTNRQFRTEILNKMKCVKVFDLTRSTDLGIFLDKSITQNNNFPKNSCEITFDNPYSSIFGFKYPLRQTNSGIVEESFSMDFSNEMPFYDLQSSITNKFKSQGVIYPHILNLNFLFDDTPATPTSLRKWSLNRYMGFYFDSLELVITVSPTKLYSFKPDVYIDKGNFIRTLSGANESPFQDGTIIDPNNLFINVGGRIYKIKEVIDLNTSETTRVGLNSLVSVDSVVRKSVKRYKILSDTKLFKYAISNDSLLDQIFVKYENGENVIYYKNNLPFVIDNYDDSDMWLIKIDQDFFKLVKNLKGYITIYSDHAFVQTDSKFEYYINDPDTKFKKSYNTVLKEVKEPLRFNIYRCKFTEIKDFDNDFIETEFAKFEYEKDDELTFTDESKLYVNNKKSGTVDDFKFGTDVVNIPASSEYTSNDETFRVHKTPNDMVLTKLWSKNPNFVKWGFKNSICANDYPYLLNNSLIADPFNRSTNFIEPIPKRVEKNLDYFYSINSDSSDYTHHSLHVEDQIGGQINTNFKFEIDKYLGLSYSLDYFTYFFGKRNEYYNGRIIKNVKKWSYFNGDTYETNSTLFKGLKLVFREVTDATNLANIVTKNTEEFTDYKFSILLSENNYSVTSDEANLNLAKVEKQINSLRWVVIEQWKSGKKYTSGTLVIFNDIIFVAQNDVTTTTPRTPFTERTDWDYYTSETIFWRPSLINNFSDKPGFRAIVYNYGQYYIKSQSGVTGDFFNPDSSYSVGEIVLFRGAHYIAIQNNGPLTDSIKTLPTNERYWEVYKPKKAQDYISFRQSRIWVEVPEWKPTALVNPDGTVFPFTAITYGGVLYGTTVFEFVSSINPQSDPRWVRIHTFKSDSSIIYGPSVIENNITKINEQIYLCLESTPQIPIIDGTRIDRTLDDGINIYINKKFKNILLNIYVNDNTFTNARLEFADWIFYDNKISNINRDKLYDSLLYKLTASNLYLSLLFPNLNFGFIDKMRYIIINEDSTINIYDFNNPESAKRLPYILYPTFPNPIQVRLGQIVSKGVDVDQNILKPVSILDDGLVTTKSTINNYSDLPVANVIEYKDIKARPLPQTLNINQVPIYRHSGYYSPIFREIPLFKSNTLDKNYDNFKFDTDLTEFGMTGEIIVSKVNRQGSVLKLKNSNKFKSIYPMLDEIGYHVVKRYIFKSTWDFNYYFECYANTRDVVINVGDATLNSSVELISDEKILTIKKTT